MNLDRCELKRVRVAFLISLFAVFKKQYFHLKSRGFVFLHESGTSRTMPLHTETSPQQLYSHARSHINGSHSRLPQLLTISRSSTLQLDGRHVLFSLLLPPPPIPVATSILNRCSMILLFAVFYPYLTIRQNNPELRHYYYKYTGQYLSLWSIDIAFTKSISCYLKKIQDLIDYVNVNYFSILIIRINR